MKILSAISPALTDRGLEKFNWISNDVLVLPVKFQENYNLSSYEF